MQATAVHIGQRAALARRTLLFVLLTMLTAAFLPRLALSQGPGTEYLECLDRAEYDLAMCYWEADGYRWRERMCNFAYYVDNIACAGELIL